MIRALIFDFNGVIVESTDQNAQIYAEIFSDFGQSVVHQIKEHYKQTGGIPRQKRIEMYLREFAGVEPTESLIEEYSNKFRQKYLKSLEFVELVPCVREFFTIYENKYDIFLSSGAPQQDIPEMLRRLNLEKYFLRGYGAPKTKTEHINDILCTYAYKPDEVIFIGDSPKDKEAAQNNGIFFIARERGLDSLKKEQYKIFDLCELAKEIERIENDLNKKN